MRYKSEHKQDTHRKLLEVAADAIRADGPHQVGVAGIMAKAGLTHGGFYAHFASKDELVAEAIGEMFEQSVARFRRETDDRPPAEALWAYIRFYLSRGHRDTNGKGCPVAALLSDIPRVSEAAGMTFSEGAGRLKQKLAGLLETLDYADADAQADSLLAELVGALMLARAEPDKKRSDEILMRSRQALKQRFHLESVAE